MEAVAVKSGQPLDPTAAKSWLRRWPGGEKLAARLDRASKARNKKCHPDTGLATGIIMLDVSADPNNHEENAKINHAQDLSTAAAHEKVDHDTIFSPAKQKNMPTAPTPPFASSTSASQGRGTDSDKGEDRSDLATPLSPQKPASQPTSSPRRGKGKVSGSQVLRGHQGTSSDTGTISDKHASVNPTTIDEVWELCRGNPKATDIMNQLAGIHDTFRPNPG